MAPSIPTHRPLMTATRLAVSVAVAACVSSLYLAFGSAWAMTELPAQGSAAAAYCPAAGAQPATHSADAGAREERAALQ